MYIPTKSDISKPEPSFKMLFGFAFLLIEVLLLPATGNIAFAADAKLGDGPGGVSISSVMNVVTVTIQTKDPKKLVSAIQLIVPKEVAIKELPSNSTATTLPNGDTVINITPPNANSTGAKSTFKTENPIGGKEQKITVKVTYPGGKIESTDANDKESEPKQTKLIDPAKKQAINSQGKDTVSFSATTGALTFTNDFVTDTGFPGDILVGSNVIVPSYTLLGPSADGLSIVFVASDDDFLKLQIGTDVVFEAAAPFLFYSIADNEFSAGLSLLGLAGATAGTAFFDLGLSTLFSPSLALLNSELNPGDASFLTDIPFAASFTPSSNFFAITDDYSEDGSSGFVDSIFITAPEPASIWVLVSGLVALVPLRRRRNSIAHWT